MSAKTIYAIQSDASLAISAGAVFAPLCSLMVGLRFYARKRNGVGYGVDDWTILGALFFVICMAIALIVETSQRNDASEAVTASSQNADIAEWIFELLQVPALGLVKASFLFLYQRVFATNITKKARDFRWATNGMLILVAAWVVAFFVAFILICDGNPSAWWSGEAATEEQCTNTIKLHNAFAITDTILDLYVIILPIPEVWALKLPLKKRLGIMGAFLLGAFSVVLSAFRAAVYLHVDIANPDPITNFEFFKTGGVYLSMLESGLCLCAACLPIIWTLVVSWRRKVKQGRTSQAQETESGTLRTLSNASRSRLRNMLDRGPTPDASQSRLLVDAARTSGEESDSERIELPDNCIMITHSIDMTEERARTVE